jgi:hypothetical protein
MLIRLVFVVWIVTITVLAVIPHSDDGLMVASNVTPSGMEKHVIYAGIEDNAGRAVDRGRRARDGGLMTEVRVRRAEDEGPNDGMIG